jgi:hypothetical protein
MSLHIPEQYRMIVLNLIGTLNYFQHITSMQIHRCVLDSTNALMFVGNLFQGMRNDQNQH